MFPTRARKPLAATAVLSRTDCNLVLASPDIWCARGLVDTVDDEIRGHLVLGLESVAGSYGLVPAELALGECAKVLPHEISNQTVLIMETQHTSSHLPVVPHAT